MPVRAWFSLKGKQKSDWPFQDIPHEQYLMLLWEEWLSEGFVVLPSLPPSTAIMHWQDLQQTTVQRDQSLQSDYKLYRVEQLS